MLESSLGYHESEKILIVDDEADIRSLVGMLLAEEGRNVLTAGTIEEAEKLLASNDVALALVDLRLRDKDGLELVRKLSLDPCTGIIILSGKGAALDRVIGIEVGADDYITKPFEPRELVARVKRHLSKIRLLRERMRSDTAQGPIVIGDWIIDPARHAVVNREGDQADLSESEFRTLVCLGKNRGQVLTRDAIYNYVVGPGDRDPMDRRIDVYVSSLRKKLGLREQGGIRTVHRVGYVVD